MLDLNTIEAFSMTYVFIDEDGEAVYEYEQVSEAMVAADGSSVSFVLKDMDEDSEDDTEYSFTLVKTDEDEFAVKSDYFEDAEELYELDMELTDDEVCFSSENDEEKMYLYGFFA